MSPKLRVGLILAAIVIVVLLVASQLVIPGLVASFVEDRLTEDGGRAEVSVSAFPALRLLFDDGDRIEVDASELQLERAERQDALGRLDGFDEVDVEIGGSELGPVTLERVRLTRRSRDRPYRLEADGDTSPADVVSFGAGALGIPGGGLAGLAFSDTPVPVALDVELKTRDGRADVISGGGTVAGLPTGPLGELITEAIVARL